MDFKFLAFVAGAMMTALLATVYQHYRFAARRSPLSMQASVQQFLVRSGAIIAIGWFWFWYGSPIDYAPYSELFGMQNPHFYATAMSIFNLVECVVWIPMLVNFASFFLYPPTSVKTHSLPEAIVDMRQSDEVVCFRFVTRGDNPKALMHAVRGCQSAIRGQKQTSVHVVFEIVTDTFIHGLDVPQIVVPAKSEYQTKNNTLYKARALHYATEASDLRDKDWIMHMDEESTIDKQNLDVCLRWIFAENRRRSDLGQGLISYNNTSKFEGLQHYICTVADSIRVADDMFRFRFQYDFLHTCPFGVHGSFLIVNNGFEKEVGLDVGPDCSVTEDTAFALKTAAAGAQWHHLEAEVQEQSPINFRDFCHQRARWMKGLWYVVLDKQAEIRTSNKVVLATMLVPWTMAPVYFAYIVTYIVMDLTHGGLFYQSTEKMHRIIAYSFLMLYIIGFVRSQWFKKFPFWRALSFYATLPFALYAALFFEFLSSCFAVYKTICGLLTKSTHVNGSAGTDFHVVRKDLKSHDDELSAPLLAGA